MEHAKHIIRVVLLMVVVLAVFVVVRHFAIPKSFGLHGHYRFDSVAEFAAQPLAHGAPGACADCHEEQAEACSSGTHGAVSCEVCHAPLNTHVKGQERVAPMPVHRSFKLCARCHQRLVARPKEFPQVVLRDHVIEKGGEEMADTICLECHDAHDPSD